MKFQRYEQTNKQKLCYTLIGRKGVRIVSLEVKHYEITDRRQETLFWLPEEPTDCHQYVSTFDGYIGNAQENV